MGGGDSWAKINHKCAVCGPGVVMSAGSGVRAHTGQMQRWPRSCSGRRLSAALDTVTCRHQQSCGSAPEAMAHSLGWPQAGQAFGGEEGEGFMKRGAARTWSVGQGPTQRHPKLLLNFR